MACIGKAISLCASRLYHTLSKSTLVIRYKSTDFVHPEISILNPEPDMSLNSIISIEANIIDNIELDESRIYVFLNNRSVDRNKLTYNSNTSILEFNWNTIKYNDGSYEIRIVAYDKEGNKGQVRLQIPA